MSILLGLGAKNLCKKSNIKNKELNKAKQKKRKTENKTKERE